MRRHVRVHAVFPDAELPMRRHRATIILIAHASIFTLSDDCFETIGGCVLRLWAYDDWRRPKAWSTTTLDLIPMVTATWTYRQDYASRLKFG